MLQDEIIERNRKTIDALVLTQAELAFAIFEGKKRKFFFERGNPYYIDLEKSCKESKITQTKLSSQS